MLVVCALAQAQESKSACDPNDKKCIYEALVASPAKKLSFWQPWFDKPIEQRVGPAPAEVRELLLLDNLLHGYPERPHASTVTDEFRDEVVAALAQIPAPVKRRLADRLAGIVFVDEFGSTGFTDSIADASGRKSRAFIVLDPAILAKRTANA